MSEIRKYLLAFCVLLAAAGVVFGQSGTKKLRDYDIKGLEKTLPTLESFQPTDVVTIIYTIAHEGGIKNVVISKGVQGLTTRVAFADVTVGEALEVVLSVNHLAYEVKDGIIKIMTDEEYTKQFGASFYDKKEVKMVDLKYADPDNVSKMLGSIKSSLGTIVSDKVTGSLILIDTPSKISAMEAVIKQADISTITRVLPTETKSFVLQYAAVADLEEDVKSLLTPNVGTVQSDARTKTLIVTDLPHKVERIAYLVGKFDTRLKEVFIESKIVQVTLSDDYRMGVNWNHLFNGMDPRFSLRSAVGPKIATALGDVTLPEQGVGSLTYKTIVGGGDLSLIVDALKQVGDTKILSNPHVAVMNGQEAEIATVREQPYAEAQFESGSTNVIGESLQFIPVGVTLKVSPTINDEDMIQMDIRPEVSTLDGFYNAKYPIPIVKKAYTETSVMIKDGETILIAGMIEDEKREVDTSVPILGKIPLVGILFRSKTDISESRETVVFLTPRLMTGEEPVLRLRDMKKKPKPLRSTRSRKYGKPIRSLGTR